MDKILAFLKEAKWFSISIGIFMVIWLGPKLLDKIEEIQAETERQARIEQQEIARQEQLKKEADEMNPLYKAFKDFVKKEYLGFVCNSNSDSFEIKFILEKFDGKFVGSKTFYNQKTKGSSDHRIETYISGEGYNDKYSDYHKFYEYDETITFQVYGKYKSHDLHGTYLILNRNDLSFLIEKKDYGRVDFSVNGQCVQVNHESLLKEQTEHNLKIKENNVL